MPVIPTRLVNQIAARIEGAYRRSLQGSHPLCDLDDGVWVQTAQFLIVLNRENPELPLDPELYVLSQIQPEISYDLSQRLMGREAVARYRHWINRIVRNLRRELKGEIRCIRRWIKRGLALDEALNVPSHKVSPLGRYLTAYLAGRPEVAADYLLACAAQHDSCPLYRQAFLAFAPSQAYPGHKTATSSVPINRLLLSSQQTFQMN